MDFREKNNQLLVKRGEAIQNQRIKRLFESKASPYLFRGFDLQSGRAGNNAVFEIKEGGMKNKPDADLFGYETPPFG